MARGPPGRLKTGDSFTGFEWEGEEMPIKTEMRPMRETRGLNLRFGVNQSTHLRGGEALYCSRFRRGASLSS